MSRKTFTKHWLETHLVHQSPMDRDEVIGLSAAMAEIQSVIARLKDPEGAALLGAIPPNGLLFYGPPGSGKSHAARWTASQLGQVPFYQIPSDELSPNRLRGTVQWLAAAHPRSVVFIDDADWALNRDHLSHSPESRDLLNAALLVLDSLSTSSGPILILATNRHPFELDAALIRSGRIGIHIAFDGPTESDREAYFASLLRDRPTVGMLDTRRAARLTRGKSFADVKAMTEDSAAICLADGRNAITDEDLIAAVHKSGEVVEDAAPTRRTAVHESAHSCVAVVLRGSDWVSSIMLDASGGHTQLGSEDLRHAERPDDELRDIVAVTFAGAAGEAAILGEPTLASASDVNLATSLSIQRLNLGFEPGHPAIDLDDLGRNVSESLKASLGDQVAESLRSARETARRIVAANVAEIDAFATILESAGGDLSGPALASAIKEVGFRVPSGEA